MEWFGFWIFMSVCVVIDGWLYSKGHEGFFFTHKTEAEKKIRDRHVNGDVNVTTAPATPQKEEGRDV